MSTVGDLNTLPTCQTSSRMEAVPFRAPSSAVDVRSRERGARVLPQNRTIKINLSRNRCIETSFSGNFMWSSSVPLVR